MAHRAYEMATSTNGLAVDASLDRAGLQNVMDLRARLEGRHPHSIQSRFLDLGYYEDAINLSPLLSPTFEE